MSCNGAEDRSISGATGTFAGSLAAGVLDPSKLVGSNFTKESVGFNSVVTMPYDGKVRWTIVGGGGGGGGGGISGASGIAGLPGSPGGVHTGELTVPAGTVITVTIGAGGAGAASGSSISSPPSGSAGGNTSISVSGFGTWTGTGGAGGGTSSSPSGAIGYSYSMADPDDFGGVPVAPAGSAPSGVPGSYAGARALSGYGTFIAYLQLSGNAGALNGGGGYRGGPGAGGAPTKAWVSSRELYADPVDGEGGDGLPTSAGGNGGNGYAFIEIYNPNSVVLRDEFIAATDPLRSAVALPPTWTEVYSNGTGVVSVDLLSTYGPGNYCVKWSDGYFTTIWTNPVNSTTPTRGWGDEFGSGYYNVTQVWRMNLIVPAFL